jgi:hypothetical protein
MVFKRRDAVSEDFGISAPSNERLWEESPKSGSQKGPDCGSQCVVPDADPYCRLKQK